MKREKIKLSLLVVIVCVLSLNELSFGAPTVGGKGKLLQSGAPVKALSSSSVGQGHPVVNYSGVRVPVLGITGTPPGYVDAETMSPLATGQTIKALPGGSPKIPFPPRLYSPRSQELPVNNPSNRFQSMKALPDFSSRLAPYPDVPTPPISPVSPAPKLKTLPGSPLVISPNSRNSRFSQGSLASRRAQTRGAEQALRDKKPLSLNVDDLAQKPVSGTISFYKTPKELKKVQKRALRETQDVSERPLGDYPRGNTRAEKEATLNAGLNALTESAESKVSSKPGLFTRFLKWSGIKK